MTARKFLKGEQKTFENDLITLFLNLRNHTYFAQSKAADGEQTILENKPIDIRSKCNGEFHHDPDDEACRLSREDLIKSVQHKAENYFVGISCPCCVGQRGFEWFRDFTGLPEENLTWANLMVNANYPKYKEKIVPLFSEYPVVIVCNKKAALDHLPFTNSIVADFRIGTDAWINDRHVIDEMKEWIDENDARDHLFLFCAGPFGNILGYHLFNHAPENTFLDVGSTLDPWLFGLKHGLTRGYLAGAPTLNKTCVWG
jgi:hypothetical protein